RWDGAARKADEARHSKRLRFGDARLVHALLVLCRGKVLPRSTALSVARCGVLRRSAPLTRDDGKSPKLPRRAIRPQGGQVGIVGGDEKLAHIVWDRDHAEVPGEGIRQAKGVTAGKSHRERWEQVAGVQQCRLGHAPWCLAGSRVLARPAR